MSDRNRLPACSVCVDVKCERDIGADFSEPQNASTGEMVSQNAGIGPTQVAEGNAMLQAAGRDAYYDERGALHCKDRRTFNKVLQDRGLFNRDEVVSPKNV